MNFLSEKESKDWAEIVNSEPKVENKKQKPPKELVDRIKEWRTKKKTFVASLSKDKQEKLLNGNKGKNNGKTNEQKKVDKEVYEQNLHEKRLKTIDTTAIKDEYGNICELFDIGINIQVRYSKENILRVFERSYKAGVTRTILTGCDLKSSQAGIALCNSWYGRSAEHKERYPYNEFENHKLKIYATVGIHPHDAKSVYLQKEKKIDETKFSLIRTLASSPFCVSLGECGLDYDRMFSPMQVQREVFDEQVKLAVELNRPLFVHLRERGPDKGEPLGAVEHAMEIFAKHPGITPSKICVHCFTGDKNDLEQLTSRGFLIGITGYAGIENRATASGTLEALADPQLLKIENLMIETDTPFMTPKGKYLTKEFKNVKNNEPALLTAVCRAVAERFHDGKYEPYQIAKQTTQTAIQFFEIEQADAKINNN